ncbi:hypothetical protein [Streptomyces sp. NPDC001165]|uniref:hypothetical protein n=1 Tax=Streptomyces sp. NPDC001165 TaxID=3364546 RepID=UPI00367DDDFB
MDKRRVMEIWNQAGKAVGTGYLITDRLVLTAFHNVETSGDLEVRALEPVGATDWVAAELIWPQTPPDVLRNPEADAALIRIKDPKWVPPTTEPVRWGTIGGGSVVYDEALTVAGLGFPQSEVRDDGVRDTKHIGGRIEPLTGLKSRGLITLYLSDVATPGDHSWTGASGAAIFCRQRLVGIVTIDRSRYYSGDQLTAVSVAALADRPGFAETVRAAGGELALEDVGVLEGTASHTVYGIDVPPGLNNLPDFPAVNFVGREQALTALEHGFSENPGVTAQTVHGRV